MNTYKVKVNKEHEFEIRDSDISNMDAIKISATKSHVLEHHSPYVTEITHHNFQQKKYTVKVNSNSYEVVIADQLDILIDTMGFSMSASKQVDSIKAPMPGLILDILVHPGEAVDKNGFLLVLEAMKMENMITAPRAGIIKSISVRIGDAVEKGKLLLEFE